MSLLSWPFDSRRSNLCVVLFPFFPLATVTSSSENEERCGSSLEWVKNTGSSAFVKDTVYHGSPSTTPLCAEEPALPNDAQLKNVTATESHPALSDGLTLYHSTSLNMPRPSSVAGQ